LSYTPARGANSSQPPAERQASRRLIKTAFEWQTPRRWGWGTPLKKRAATRTERMLAPAPGMSTIPNPRRITPAGNPASPWACYGKLNRANDRAA